MKKLIALVLLAVFLIAPCPSVWAAADPGTVTVTVTNAVVDSAAYKNGLTLNNIRKIVTIAWVASADTAGVPVTTLNASTLGITNWFLYSAETDPSTGPPTDNYDVTITDTNGLDLAAGLLMNRSTTVTQIILAGATSAGFPIVRGNLTFTLTNNLVNSAAGTVILVFLSN